MPGILEDLRREYHTRLCDNLLGFRSGVVNVADKSSEASKELALAMTQRMRCTLSTVTKSGQTLGKEFGEVTARYLEDAFTKLHHIRPGNWLFTTSQASQGIGGYDQYRHLVDLQRLLNEEPRFKTALGEDYLITPDIVIGRWPVLDDTLNENELLVDTEDGSSKRSPLRGGNVPNSPPVLHASISCKWTMRSDRAQNTRTEALNLIRNRKGNTPHIVVVTVEPLPTRLASIAMGTGDVDCSYHAALNELLAATKDVDRPDQLEVLESLIDGRRIRDISDLPLDLAI